MRGCMFVLALIFGAAPAFTFVEVLALTLVEAADASWCAVVLGSLGKNCGTMRAFITCSKPEASLMSVGSLKAVPVKVMPTGNPNEFPIGTLIAG